MCRSKQTDLVVIFALLVVAYAWSSLPFWFPGGFPNERFLFNDEGYQLLIVDDLLHHKILYKDIFSQYGPLPAYVHAGVARLFGNTAQVYLRLMQGLSLINVVLAYLLLRRGTQKLSSATLIILGLFPVFLLPGALGNFRAMHPLVGMERMLLLGIALAYCAVTVRTPTRSLCLGLLVGAMQFVKFGGAAVAGAALLSTDFILLTYEGNPSGKVVGWIKSSLWIFLGFLLMESALCLASFMILPPAIAEDVLWPVYMLRNYASYTDGISRFPPFVSFGYSLGNNFPVLMSSLMILLMFALVTMAKVLPKWTRPKFVGQAVEKGVLGPAIFLCAFFVVGFLVYMKHLYAVYSFCWILIIVSGWQFDKLHRWLQVPIVLLWLPACWLCLKLQVPHGRLGAATNAVKFPGGETLCLNTETIQRLDRLQQVIQAEANRTRNAQKSSFLFFPNGGGLDHFYQLPHATRYAWFMPGFVPDREDANILKSFDETVAVVLLPRDVPLTDPSYQGPPPRDPRDWHLYSIPPLPEGTCAMIANRLDAPIRIDDSCWVFPVKDNATVMDKPQ